MQGWDQNLDFLGFSTDTVWWQGLVLPAGWDRSPRSLLNLLRCCLLRVDVQGLHFAFACMGQAGPQSFLWHQLEQGGHCQNICCLSRLFWLDREGFCWPYTIGISSFLPYSAPSLGYMKQKVNSETYHCFVTWVLSFLACLPSLHPSGPLPTYLSSISICLFVYHLSSVC